MTKEQASMLVDDILKDKPDIIDRGELANILGVSYASVPKEVASRNIPLMTENIVGSWKRIKVHKTVLKQHLINQYTKNQEEK